MDVHHVTLNLDHGNFDFTVLEIIIMASSEKTNSKSPPLISKLSTNILHIFFKLYHLMLLKKKRLLIFKYGLLIGNRGFYTCRTKYFITVIIFCVAYLVK